jgi:very-short-patch-repair endonuclease
MSKERTPEHMIELAKQLRQNQTNAESFLWHLLRNRQVANAKFRRQQPIEGYIADFYCHEHKLIIELDGSQHFTDDGIKKDAQRTARLNALGIEVLRFDNRQVLTEIEAVLQMIYERLKRPHPCPLPEGEGVKSTHSEIGSISSPLPQGEDLGEGVLIKKNLAGLGYEL